MKEWRIGIVGGGPGGLMSAYALQRVATEPFAATIFEAGSRLGGKVLTERFTLAPVAYEAGAAEMYDYSAVGEDALRDLVAELGLAAHPMRGEAVVVDGKVLSNLDDVETCLGRPARNAISAFDRRSRDRIGPRDFYHADEVPFEASIPGCRFDAELTAIADGSARTYIETLIHSDLATEPHETTVQYGMHNYLMNNPAYMSLYSIEGGNERLAQELAARVRATKLLDHPVVRIGRGADRPLEVTATHRGRTLREEFDFVVLALPNSYLPAIAFDGDRLAVAMARHHARYDHPAHYLRVTALFERPFWRSTFQDSYCMLDRFGGCCLYDESSRDPGASHAVLGWLIGGAAAREMSGWTDCALIEAALDSLPPSLVEGRRLLMEGQVHRWIGAVSAIPGGLMPQGHDRRHQPEPREHPHLFVVGDYLFDSTLNGVLDSAEYVAGWIAARMADARGE